MATNRRDLSLYLVGKDVSASRSLRGLSNEAKRSESRLSRFGGVAMTALKGVGIAAGAAAVAGVAMGIKTAASMEQAKVAFTTLLGSAGKAQKYLDDLSTFAAKTPFEFPGLVDSSRLLLGVGVASKDVIPTLTAFGDAAGALGIQQDSFQRIMLATTQSIAAGKVKLGDMNQLMNNGLPVWKLLSEAMHKPVAKIQDLISHGKLLTKDVLPKLKTQMEKDYGGAMERQSQTLSGLWSTFMDTLNLGLAKAITPLIPALKVGLAGAADAVGVALGGIVAVLGVAQDAISGFMGAFTGQGSMALDNFSRGPANALIDAGVRTRQVFDALRTAFTEIWAVVRTQIVPVFVDFARGALAQLKESFGSISAAVRENGPQLKQLATAVGAIIVVLLRLAGPVLKYGVIHQLTMFTKVTTFVITAIGWTVRAFVGLADASKAVARVMRNAVGEAAGFVLDTFATMLDGMLSFAATFISGAASAFGWVPGIGGKLKHARDEFNDFREGLVNNLHELADRARGDGERIGTYISNGIVAGLNYGKRIVGNAAGQLVISAKDGATSTARIASPSKLFRDDVGKPIALGIAKGIEDIKPRVVDRISEMLDAVADVIHSKHNGITKATEHALSGMRREFNAAANDYDRTRSRLSGLRSDATSYRTGLRDSLVGGADITGAGTTSAAGVIAFLGQESAGLKAFRRNIATLRKRHVNKRIIDQLLSAGLDGGGGALAATLATANAGDIKRINALESSIVDTSKATAKTATEAEYGRKLDRVSSHLNDIEHHLRTLAHDIGHELKHAERHHRHHNRAKVDA